MTRISLWMLVMALGLSTAAYAQGSAPTNKPANNKPSTSQGQTAHNDKQAIHQDYQALNTDDDEIRALGKQRNDALRSGNAALAEKLQAEIDQKRAARKNLKADINKNKEDLERQRHQAEAERERQKRLAEEQCAKDPKCAMKKKHEELERQLQGYKQRLTADEAAAARVSQDKAEIAKIEAELKK